jgi:2-hydroxychromene-2-carboxylate isomerase
MTTPIELFFDIGSTYSYLAASQVKGISERTGRKVVWRPFLLGGVFKATSNSPPVSVAARAVWLLKDAQRWADEYGLPMKMPSRFPVMTLPTERALVACELSSPEKLPDFACALFRAYWEEDRDPTDLAEIGACAKAVGLEPERIGQAMGTQEVKDHLKKTTEEAVERGAFGAPSFFVDGEMFFGNDRITQMERWLAKRR